MAIATKLVKSWNLISKSNVKSSLISPKRGIGTAEKPTADRECEEIDIKVPWGKIAGKLWGSPDVPPILALHGWQDNAGAFDPLLREFPKDLSVLAVDLPGHGHSSWLPSGMMYTAVTYLQTIHRVKEHFKMKKVGLMAHSFGGMLSFNYATHFPDDVKFVVAFDFYKYPTHVPDKFLRRFAGEWKRFYEIEARTSAPPRYSEEEATQKYIKARDYSVNKEMCEILFVRGVTRHADGTVSYSRDPRVHMFFDPGFTDSQLRAFANQIKCPYVVLKAEGSPYNDEEKSYFDILKVIEERSPDFHFHTLPGTHHFHMVEPKKIADLIGPFVKKYA